MNRTNLFAMSLDFDGLMLLRGEDFKINDLLTVHHARLGEVCDFGEEAYFNVVHTLCAMPADYQVQLFDIGIDYMNITEFDFFMLMAKGLSYDETSLLLGNIDFKRMKVVNNSQTGEPALFDSYSGLMIDRAVQTMMTDFLRKVHGLKKNTAYAANELTKQMMIEFARRDQQHSAMKRQRDGYQSVFAPYISALTNCAESKYDIFNVWDLPIYTFFDSIKRINKIKLSGYMMQGAYNGWVDGSKFSKKDLDWMGELK